MLDIIQEGPGWAVINKPAGIATERHYQYDTVEARAQVAWQRGEGGKPAYVGVVHRLDRPVSGALLLARKKSVLVKLNRAFADRQTTKVYRAVTATPLPEEAGTLRHFLGRSNDRKRATASTRPVPGAQEGILQYRLLRQADGLYEYELRPTTGRFHQLRVQLATAGAAIVGDHAYGSMRPLQDNVIALHASALTFPDPREDPQEKQAVEVHAPLPDYWPLQ